MILRRFWFRIWGMAPLAHPSVVPDVLGTDEFRRLVVRERNRADRVHSELSLITLDLSGVPWSDLRLTDLLFALRARVRETDAVGWFDRKSLGILLPDTGAHGALLLAADLRDKLLASLSGAGWRILTYPDDRLLKDDHDEDQGSGARHGDAAPVSGRGRAVNGAASTNGTPQPQKTNGTPQPQKVGAAGRKRVSVPPKAQDVEGGFEVASLRSALLIRRSPLTRLLDILVASVALLILSPVILLAALAVKLTSPGPALFSQARLGQGGRPFTFYKLRSMCADAPARKKDVLALNEQDGPVFKATFDPRITPVGRFLRKTSIDELPQLWNVLKGDMSLVGPRPPLPEEVAEYEPWQRRRLDLRGGLTCIWQVSGRSKIQFDDWVRLDLLYGKKADLWLDLAILARTVPAVLTGRGAR